MSEASQELTPKEETPLATARPFGLGDLQLWHKGVNVSRHRVTRFAKIVLLTIFGVGSVWASTAEIGGALIAQGLVITENRNRVIQNLEGGILSELHVSEGESVKVGQILATLDDAQASSRYEALEVREAILRIQLARRQAQVAGVDELTLPTGLGARVLADPRVKETIASQLSEFEALNAFVRGQIADLDSKIANAKSGIASEQDVIKAYKQQVALFERELVDYRDLLEKGLVPRRQVFATERQLYGVQADIERSEARITTLQGQVDEYTNQKSQVRLNELQKAESAAVELQKELNDVIDGLQQMKDRIVRSQLRSPVDGKVLVIHNRTLGAVLRPGETLMEVFPSRDNLLVEVKVKALDAKDVYVGQPVRIQFGNQFDKKLVPGEIMVFSDDVVQLDERDEPHYVALVRVDEGVENDQFLPGVTAQVYIETEPKTFFKIIAGPFLNLELSAFKG